MKNVLWFAAGVAAGFVVAHQINQTKQGKEFFSSIDVKTKAFSQAVVDAYHAREAELRSSGDQD